MPLARASAAHETLIGFLGLAFSEFLRISFRRFNVFYAFRRKRCMIQFDWFAQINGRSPYSTTIELVYRRVQDPPVGQPYPEMIEEFRIYDDFTFHHLAFDAAELEETREGCANHITHSLGMMARFYDAHSELPDQFKEFDILHLLYSHSLSRRIIILLTTSTPSGESHGTNFSPSNIS